jgi:glyoxylase-like metal-dependent hydrolase (beta-lactamase superfamily II)
MTEPPTAASVSWRYKPMSVSSALTYRFHVGSIDCIAVADGTNVYKASTLFANAPKEEVDRRVEQEGEAPEEVVLAYTSLVIQTNGRKVLVDTGIGAGVVPTGGALLHNLAAAGIEPSEIDTVLLTHAHPDHIGGVMGADQSFIFPNARYVMASAEWDFFTSEDNLRKFGTGAVLGNAGLEGFIAGLARRNLAAIRERVDLMGHDQEIAPGVRTVAAPGHTPGHTALVLQSRGEQLLHMVDTVLHPIHVEQVDWHPMFDLDREEAATTRRTLLNRVANERMKALSYHFPFPGLGVLTKKGIGWRWEAIVSSRLGATNA